MRTPKRIIPLVHVICICIVHRFDARMRAPHFKQNALITRKSNQKLPARPRRRTLQFGAEHFLGPKIST